MARRTWILSARNRSWLRLRLPASPQYRIPVVSSVRVMEASVYHAVSPAARDQERLVLLFEDIAHSPHSLNQLVVERVIHFGAKPSHVYIDHIRLTVEIHVPYLAGNH